MKFKIGDFTVLTTKKEDILDTFIFIPTAIVDEKPGEYEQRYKTKEFTIFDGLNLLEKSDGKNYNVISDLFDFIDLIEVLKAFNGNKLDTDKEYQISDSFIAKTASAKGKMSLSIHFKNYSYKLYLDKFECSSLAAKFSKILQRCEVWQDQDQ